jgi:hypothetical protein
MLTCGTGRSAGHWSVPKHARAACERGQIPNDFAAGDLLGVLVAAIFALQRQAERFDIKLSAAGRIGRDHRHSREEFEVQVFSIRRA